MEAQKPQNSDLSGLTPQARENFGNSRTPAESARPHTIANNFKLALLCVLAMGCGSADNHGGTTFEPVENEPVLNESSALRQFFLQREEGKEFGEYSLSAVYPQDLRFVLRDLTNEKNYSFIDTRGRTDNLDTVYSHMPASSPKGVAISVFDKASCEPDTIKCGKEIPVKKILGHGEEGIQGPSEALVY